MKETELRIGNLVFWYADGKNYEAQVTAKDLADDTIFKNFEPIPLTEEILLKCKGFYKDNYKKESKNHSAFYSISHIDYKYSFAYANFRDDWGFYHSYTDAPNDDDNNKFDFISCGIKYLHQLQNLYFALTGSELEINI